MNQALIKRVSDFLDKNPTLKGKPATNEEMARAEKELEVTLDKDYKEFIQQFGGAYAGIAIHAFSNGSSVGNETIIDLTKLNRKLANHNEVFPEINQSYVIADDGSGNPIAISPKGEIVLFDYDTEEQKILAANFETFIEDNFVEW
jgi:cell wall assembly regulator SMI1